MAAYETQENEFLFVWNVHNFQFGAQVTGECYYSPVFHAESLGNTAWNLQMFPYGISREDADYVSVFLRTVELGDEDIKIDFTMKVLVNNEVQGYFRVDNHVFSKKGNHVEWGLAKFLKTESLIQKMGNLFSDNVTITLLMKKSGRERKICSAAEARTKITADRISSRWTVDIPDDITWNKFHEFPLPIGCLMAVNLTCPQNDILINISRPDLENFPKLVLVKISLLDLNGMKKITKCASFLFKIDQNDYEFPLFLNKQLLNDNKETLSTNDSFTLECEVSISNGSKTTEIKYGYSESSVNRQLYGNGENVYCGNSDKLQLPGNDSTISNLSDDLYQLYITQKHSDIKLEGSGQIFPAHKSILAARSPVFSVMLDQDMLENRTGVVKIEDMDAEGLKIFLKFIYTDKINLLNFDTATKLIISANKYQVISLQEKCCDYFMSVMSIENVCEILSLADLLELQVLKKTAIDYIAINSARLLPSPIWNKLIESNIKLGIEVLSKITPDLSFRK